MEVDEQIKVLHEFIERNYYPQLLEAVRKGQNFLVLDFSELIKFNTEITDELSENPEELLKAAELAIKEFDLPKKITKFNVRLTNLPESLKIKINEIRSKHLNKLIWSEGVIRQKSDVRPHVSASKFECPSCGNIINMIQLDNKYKEPSKCSCGRKGKFKEISRELVDGQGIVLEEAADELDGSQPKRINVFLKEDLVSPISERRTSPGSRVKLCGWVTEVPTLLKTGGQSTKYDLIIEANFVESLQDDYIDMQITEQEEEEIKKIARSSNVLAALAGSIAPSIYGHDRIKEALVLQLAGGCRKFRPDGATTRGDIHILLIGDPGSGKCLHPKTNILCTDGSIKTIGELVENNGGSVVEENAQCPNAVFNVAALSEKGLFEPKPVTLLWKRPSPQTLLQIRTRSGSEITVTENHPFFVTKNGLVFAKSAGELTTADFIATPRMLRVEGCLQSLNPSFQPSRSRNRREVIVPKFCDEEMARLLGYLVGDGYVAYSETSGWVTLTNNNLKMLKDFKTILESRFNAKVIERDPHKGKSAKECYVTSIGLVRMLESIEPTLLLKSNGKRIPDVINKSPNYILADFLRALFECEGSINLKKRSIEISSASKNLIFDLKTVLLRFGIICFVSVKHKCATNAALKRKREYYEIQIYGEFVNLFAQEIGFLSKEKQEKLFSVCTTKHNTNTDVIPCVNEIFKVIRSNASLLQRELGLSRGTYLHYELGDRHPSRTNFKKVVETLKENVKNSTLALQLLEELGSSDIFWDKIDEIRLILSNTPYVYDLQVEDVHNYVANTIIVHNSQLLKRITTVAPKARFTSGKGASLDYREPIIIKEKESIKVKMIGDLIEENCIDKEGVFLPFRSDLQALAFNPKTLKLEWRRINYGYKHKTEELLYEIELETGRSVVVTGDHSIFGVEKGDLICREASNLKKGDTLIIPSTLKHAGTINNKDIARLLGYFIAEGNARSEGGSYKIEFTLHKKELDITAEIENCSKRIFNLGPKIHQKGDNGVTVILYGKEIHHQFKKWLGPTYGKHAKEKRIPQFVFNMDLESQKEFIRAYIKGDGGVTKSKELMSDLLYLFLNQDIIAGCNKRKDERPRKIGDRTIKAEGLRFDLKSPHPCKEYNHQYKSIPLTALDSEIREKHCRNIISSKYCRFNWERISHPKILERVLFIGRNSGISGPELTKKYTESVMDYLKKNPELYVRIKRGRTNYVYLTSAGEKLYHKLKNCKSLSQSDFGFCRIKNIKRVKSTNNYVYDISIKGFENFVAGFGGIICHNTAAGLTASVVKDEFLGGWSLEAGTLVLANRGFAVIDEMDKMNKEDRSALHEALEQQTVSISKANIQATLRCETTVLAAANPKLGRFDPYDLIAKQIDLPPTLINRFDLIFPIKDLPNREKDEETATFILNLHRDPEGSPAEISTTLLKKYFAYVRQRINPRITDQAIEELKEYYISVRNSGGGEGGIKTVPITARQLEALVRISEAAAKLRLAKTVTKKDAQKAIELLDYYLNEVAKDKETGTIDIDRIGSRITATQRSTISVIKEIITALEGQLNTKVIPVDNIIEAAQEKNIPREQVEETLEKLRRSGDLFEPKRNFVQKL